MPDSPPVLALVRDLLFVSRISATATATQTQVAFIRDPAKLTDQSARLLLVDLNLPNSIDRAAAWKHTTNGRVVGFVSHTDAQTIAAAQSAGLDEILPRSRFVERLDDLLKSAATNPT